MGKKACFVLLLVAASSAPAPAATPTTRPSPDANVIDGHYIVVYNGAAESVRAETDTREHRLGFETDFRYRSALKGFAGELTRGQVRALEDDPEVAYVAPDRRVEASSLVPLASGETVPTGVRRIRAGTTTTVEHASGAGVAVLDSGVDLTHPDLNVSNGTNCLAPGTPADDDNGHGTHVAGTIAAKNNGGGVVGVAPGTRIWAVKVLNSSGSGSYSQIVCGLNWVTANAAAKNIKVINMSLGGPGDPVEPCSSTSDPLHQAVCRATAAGVLSVAAAGNDGFDFDYAPEPETPAAYPEVLAVTAMSDSDGRPGGTAGAPSCDSAEADDFPATFSNFAGTSAGATHTVAAPGVCITSTWPTNLSPSGYATASGTSMAAPHIAAIAALCENHDGRTGECASSPVGTIEHIRGELSRYTWQSRGHGFTYDPLHDSIDGLYFGYLGVIADGRAPDTTIGGGAVGLTRWPVATFRFDSNEVTGRFECSWDGSAWATCAQDQNEVRFSDGPHTLAVRAVDRAGNADPSPATRSWTVDSTAPQTSIDSAPKRRTVSRSAKFGFSSDEAVSRFVCKVDGGAWAVCASPEELTRLARGSHSVSVAAVDVAGNVDPSPARRVWKVMPTTDQLESRLRDDLTGVAKRLRRFGIARLVNRGGFTAKGIDPLVGGRVSLALSGRPQGNAGVARSAVLAKGSRSVSGAGRYAVKLKLTRPGRRLLRDDRRARVTVRIKFRDAMGRLTTTARSLALRA